MSQFKCQKLPTTLSFIIHINLAILGVSLLPENTLCIGYRLKSHCFSLKFGENLPVKKITGPTIVAGFALSALSTSLRQHLQRCSV